MLPVLWAVTSSGLSTPSHWRLRLLWDSGLRTSKVLPKAKRITKLLSRQVTLLG